MTRPATIADLVRLEGEIDEALLDLFNRPGDEKILADLKSRKHRLHEKIECMLHEVDGPGRGPH